MEIWKQIKILKKISENSKFPKTSLKITFGKADWKIFRWLFHRTQNCWRLIVEIHWKTKRNLKSIQVIFENSKFKPKKPLLDNSKKRVENQNFPYQNFHKKWVKNQRTKKTDKKFIRVSRWTQKIDKHTKIKSKSENSTLVILHHFFLIRF